MTVTLPDRVAWTGSGWIVRRFFADAAAHLAEVPGLAPKIEDALESGIQVLGLADATLTDLVEAELLVERVIAANLVTAGRDFRDPSAFPVYLDKLRELRLLIDEATPRPPPRSGRVLDSPYEFQVGAENAPDSPTGLECLLVAPDGRFRFQNRRGGRLLAELTGTVAEAAMDEIAGYLATSGFPAVPAHDRFPGAADFLVIGGGEQASVQEGAPLRGYGPLMRRVIPWMTYLVTCEGPAPADLQVDAA